MSSGKVASESSLCPWVLGPTFLGDPEVMLEKNSDVRLRSERTGGWEWMFLKEKQLSFSIRDLAEAAAVVLLLPSRAWTCPVAATQSRGIGGTREAGEGMGSGKWCAGALFLSCRQELMLLEIRHVGSIYTIEISKQYKPGLPTRKLVVQHLPAHHCMQVLDPD